MFSSVLSRSNRVISGCIRRKNDVMFMIESNSSKRYNFHRADALEAAGREARSRERPTLVKMAFGAITGGITAASWMIYRPEYVEQSDAYNISATLIGLLSYSFVAPKSSLLTYVGVVALILLPTEWVVSEINFITKPTKNLKLSSKEQSSLETEISNIVSDKKVYDDWQKNVSDSVAFNMLAKTLWIQLAGLKKSNTMRRRHTIRKDSTEPPLTYARSQVPRSLLEKRLKKLVADEKSRRRNDKQNQITNVESTDIQGQGQPNKDELIDEDASEVDESFLSPLLSLADINNNGFVTYPEFYRALSLVLLFDKDEGVRQQVFFEAIDANKDGYIEKDELLNFVKRLQKVNGIPDNDLTTKNFLGMKTRLATAEEICNKWIDRYDIARDGRISREEFYAMSKQIDFSSTFVFNDYLKGVIDRK